VERPRGSDVDKKVKRTGSRTVSSVDSGRRRFGMDRARRGEKSYTRESKGAAVALSESTQTKREMEGKWAAVACLSVRPGDGYLYVGIDAVDTSALRMRVSRNCKKSGEKSGNNRASDKPARRRKQENDWCSD